MEEHKDGVFVVMGHGDIVGELADGVCRSCEGARALMEQRLLAVVRERMDKDGVNSITIRKGDGVSVPLSVEDGDGHEWKWYAAEFRVNG